jgi:hypothetical protein
MTIRDNAAIEEEPSRPASPSMHYDMLMDEDHERIEDLFSKVF